MKRFFAFGILTMLFSICAFAKSATVHITIRNFPGRIVVYDPLSRYDLSKHKTDILHLDVHNSAVYTMDIDKPVCLILYFTSDQYFNCSLFVSPGDDLYFTADFAKKKE